MANEIAHVVIMAVLLAAILFLERPRVRISLFSFIAICTLILCWKAILSPGPKGRRYGQMWQRRGNDDTKAIAKLQKQLAAKDNESARHQKIDKGTSFPSNGATTLPKEEKQPTSGSSVSARGQQCNDTNRTTNPAVATGRRARMSFTAPTNRVRRFHFRARALFGSWKSGSSFR